MKAWAAPITLLLTILISFGPVVPWLGFYWDDWPTVWFLHFLGPAGFVDLFKVDRPLLGQIFRVTTALLGEDALTWQIFSLLTRCGGALAFWWVLGEIWPGQTRRTAWAVLLFAVYPGFKQQPLSITYAQSWIILAAFLLSLGAMLHALRTGRETGARSWAWWLVSWVLAAFAMFSSEYFFGLELLRPVLMGLVLASATGGAAAALGHSAATRPPRDLPTSERQWYQGIILRIARLWAPYLALMAAFLFWRLKVHDTPRGDVILLDQVQSDPAGAGLQLVGTILSDLFEAGLVAWGEGFDFSRLSTNELSNITRASYVLVVLASTAIAWIFLLSRQGESEGTARRKLRRWGWQAAGLGIFALLVAGWPFWTTDFPISLSFPFDRFMLAMILGAALLVAGLVDLLIPTRRLQAAVLAVIVGLAAGSNFLVSNEYRREWNTQKEFFWQLAWRAPAIRPGTTLISSELPFPHSSDYTLSAPLNWIYHPQGIPAELPYMFTDLKIRLETEIEALQEGRVFSIPYRTSSFSGTTSQALVIFYDPPRCLKVVDPAVDLLLPRKPRYIEESLLLSKVDLIQPGHEKPARPPEDVFGPEPAHGWCYYFQKADLARQLGDWTALGELGSEVRRLGLQPVDRNADEWAPYIIGYAHLAQWETAEQITLAANRANPKIKHFFCALWRDLLKDTPAGDTRSAAEANVQETLQCYLR